MEREQINFINFTLTLHRLTTFNLALTLLSFHHGFRVTKYVNFLQIVESVVAPPKPYMYFRHYL